MSFFNSAEPILRSKQEELDFQDRQGLLCFNLKIGDKTLISAFYTRIDQVFILWGLITAQIFITAQFAPISWVMQAGLWTVLSLIGIVGMIVLTYFWVKVERLMWLLYCWAILMLIGIALTDFGIFFGCGQLLMCICPIWLGLIGFGYFCTGIGMRSRAFTIASLIHFLGIIFLPFVGGWQFLATGLVMTINLLIFAGVQWDMRPPIDYNLLTPEQRRFNEEQFQLRQASLVKG